MTLKLAAHNEAQSTCAKELYPRKAAVTDASRSLSGRLEKESRGYRSGNGFAEIRANKSLLIVGGSRYVGKQADYQNTRRWWRP